MFQDIGAPEPPAQIGFENGSLKNDRGGEPAIKQDPPDGDVCEVSRPADATLEFPAEETVAQEDTHAQSPARTKKENLDRPSSVESKDEEEVEDEREHRLGNPENQGSRGPEEYLAPPRFEFADDGAGQNIWQLEVPAPDGGCRTGNASCDPAPQERCKKSIRHDDVRG